MAGIEQIYVDPSALVRLYLHQDKSAEVARWRRGKGGVLVTHHGRLEMTNAIALAEFRGELSKTGSAEATRWIAEDFRDGHLVQADLLWRAALDRAADLARKQTPVLGTRSLDVLHVACALELKLPRFLTFDERQRKLVTAAGLKLLRI